MKFLLSVGVKWSLVFYPFRQIREIKRYHLCIFIHLVFLLLVFLVLLWAVSFSLCNRYNKIKSLLLSYFLACLIVFRVIRPFSDVSGCALLLYSPPSWKSGHCWCMLNKLVNKNGKFSPMSSHREQSSLLNLSGFQLGLDFWSFRAHHIPLHFVPFQTALSSKFEYNSSLQSNKKAPTEEETNQGNNFNGKIKQTKKPSSSSFFFFFHSFLIPYILHFMFLFLHFLLILRLLFC